MKTKILDAVLVSCAAFTLTDTVLINTLSSNGFESIASTLNFFCLALTTILATIVVVIEKRHILPCFITVLVLFILQRYAIHVDLYKTSNDYSSSFLQHGVGGFLVGFALKDINRYIRQVAFFSFIYLFILIREPINRSIMRLDEMVTGYYLTSLTINLVLAYFTVLNKNKALFVLAIISSLTITLFTARGCGVTLLLTWILFYIRNKWRKGVSTTRLYISLAFLLITVFVLMRITLDYVLQSDIQVQTGSFVEKFANGYISSSNGRDDIWKDALFVIGNNWMKGLGFGADRYIFNGMFVHNIFLELFIDFGLPISFVILFVYWRAVIKGIKINAQSLASALIVALVLRSWVQLNFSNSYLYSMVGLMMILGISARQLVIKKDGYNY